MEERERKFPPLTNTINGDLNEKERERENKKEREKKVGREALPSL